MVAAGDDAQQGGCAACWMNPNHGKQSDTDASDLRNTRISPGVDARAAGNKWPVDLMGAMFSCAQPAPINHLDTLEVVSSEQAESKHVYTKKNGCSSFVERGLLNSSILQPER